VSATKNVPREVGGENCSRISVRLQSGNCSENLAVILKCILLVTDILGETHTVYDVMDGDVVYTFEEHNGYMTIARAHNR